MKTDSSLITGIMKKLLQRWTGKIKDKIRRWKKAKREHVSEILISQNASMPTEIHRSIRGLNDLSFWKGSEYRTILLYNGMVILRSALDNDEYENFLILCCACTIVYSNVYKHFIPIAKKMFDQYIKGCIRIYGKHTVGSNLHNLTHIVEDMDVHDICNINELSTYKYENCLNLMLQKLKGFNKPLEQISRRILESTKLVKFEVNGLKKEPFPVLEFNLAEEKDSYSKITLKGNVILSTRKIGDQWFLTHCGSIVKMRSATKISGEFKISGHSLRNICDFFISPINSTYLNIFKSDGVLNDELISYGLHSIKAKMVFLEYESEFVFIPLLHTLELFAHEE